VLFDLTSELKTEAESIAKAYKMGPMYTPPVIAQDGVIGEIHPYGGNWQGGVADPETGTLYVSSITEYQLTGLRKPDPTMSDLNYDAGSYKYMHRRGDGGLRRTGQTRPQDAGHRVPEDCRCLLPRLASLPRST
jgi:hypothetical protein